jgi:hypothetical protein
VSFSADTATRLAAELEECDAMATKGEWYVTEGDGNVYSKRDEASHPEDVGACDWDDSDIYAVTRLRNLAASAASQLRAAVGECEKVVHWKREASSAMVRAATAEQTAADLTTALAAAREEGERMKRVASDFIEAVAIARHCLDARGKGGQQVAPTHDFANLTPGAMSTLERWARSFAAVLALPTLTTEPKP